MKRAEFKKLFKECIKEAIIEEGVLSTIISEVVKGLNVGQIVEAKSAVSEQVQKEQVDHELQKEQAKRLHKLRETKQKMLEAIGDNSYNGVDLFEGTTAMTRGGDPSAVASPSSPLAGVEAGDSGVDISSIVSAGAMSKIWQQMNK